MPKRSGKTKEVYYTELRIAGGVSLFVQPLVRKKIISGLQWCCEKRGLRIYDYAILPDRIIMIANTAWGSLTDVLESFKNFSSKAVMLLYRNGKSDLRTSWMLSVFREFGAQNKPEGIHIWEPELQMRSLFKQEEIDSMSETLKRRPVGLSLVSRPEHYLYSSAHPKNPLDGWVVEATDPWS